MTRTGRSLDPNVDREWRRPNVQHFDAIGNPRTSKKTCYECADNVRLRATDVVFRVRYHLNLCAHQPAYSFRGVHTTSTNAHLVFRPE